MDADFSDATLIVSALLSAALLQKSNFLLKFDVSFNQIWPREDLGALTVPKITVKSKIAVSINTFFKNYKGCLNF